MSFDCKLSFLVKLLLFILLYLLLSLKHNSLEQAIFHPITAFVTNENDNSQDFLYDYLVAVPLCEGAVLGKVLKPITRKKAQILLIGLYLFTFFSLGYLAQIFIQSFWLRFLAIGIFLWFFSASLQPQHDWSFLQLSPIHVAHVFGAMSLAFFFQKKWGGTILFCALASLIHPSSGFVLGLIEIVSALTFTIQVNIFDASNNKLSTSSLGNYKNLRNFFSILLIFILMWKFWLQVEAGYTANSVINQLLFSYIFQFQHPANYLITHFPLSKILFSIGLSTIAFAYLVYKKLYLPLFFVMLSFIGCVVGAIGSTFFENYFVTQLQWYSSYDYLRFLGVICIIAWLDQLLKELGGDYIDVRSAKPNFKILILLLILNTGLVLWYLRKPKPTSDEVAICKAASQLTPPDALFVYPAEFTHFIEEAERSAYIHFSAEINHPKFAKNWANRMQEVYLHSPIRDKYTNADSLQKGYKTVTNQQLLRLYEQGITHFITFASENPNHAALLAQNKQYKLYQIVP